MTSRGKTFIYLCHTYEFYGLAVNQFSAQILQLKSVKTFFYPAAQHNEGAEYWESRQKGGH